MIKWKIAASSSVLCLSLALTAISSVEAAGIEKTTIQTKEIIQSDSDVYEITDPELREQIQQIRDLAQINNVELKFLSIDKSSVTSGLKPNTVGALGATCTVKGTVSFMGNSLTVEATASTCVEAAKMVADLINALK